MRGNRARRVREGGLGRLAWRSMAWGIILLVGEGVVWWSGGFWPVPLTGLGAVLCVAGWYRWGQ